ncbi:MAG: TonB-dependent receptor, partial [Rhodothermales bacterium]
MRALLFSALFLLWPLEGIAQTWGEVRGRVIEADTQLPLPGVNVVVSGTDFGTATESDGRYALKLPTGAHLLRFTTVGYLPRTDTAIVRTGGTTRLDIELRPALLELEGITVEGAAPATEPGVYDLRPEDVRNMPTPFKGFQALKALPGVATNNELSNQYSVRGGGFNENLIFINGFEVYMPFRPRQGEQEGLGLLNPELAGRITLYTGGFPARYGGKLSSALDVQYARPEGPISGAASLSLLDAGVTTGSSAADGRVGWNVGIRKARAQHFFSTQELRGTYRPDYTDVQGLFSYRIADGHDVEVLGIWADHVFNLDPQSRKTYYGIVSTDPSIPADLRSFWIRYQGREEDGYRTRFAGARLSNRLGARVLAEHDFAYFGTEEDESFDIRGSAIIFQVDPGGNPETGSGHFPTGNASQAEFAENSIDVATWTARGRWVLQAGNHAAEAGWYGRRLEFTDRINEQSTIVGRDTEGEVVRLVVDILRDAASLSASQAGLYVQDAIESGRLFATAGVRTDYFSFNDEWTISPRLSGRYRADELLTITGSWGIYYQVPTYRELRGRPETGETILGALNRDIKSQRSIQYVMGAEYFIPSRRLYARGEIYYKDLSNLISYDIQNVRVLYSGNNDADGHAYGLDLRLSGELVPGLESWLNYSYLRAIEDFRAPFETDLTSGNMPRPSDQSHTISLFVQDYVPGDDTWKVHLGALFGSGLPYTPPNPGPAVGGFVSQVPGVRNSGRYNEYRRIDMGITKLIDFGGTLRLEMTAELLNVFDMTNTVAYTWIPDGNGIWQRIPTRLTPRTFNVRAR